MMLSSPAFGLTGCRMGFASLCPSYFVLQKITSPPQSPANALGGDIGRLWKPFPSALWMALETPNAHTGGRS
jgi:hypothetical protein